MELIKSELFDDFYSVFPTNANLYLGDTQMPNHCHNRVTFYPSGNNTASSLDQIETLKDIFTGESIFKHIIPEPDWLNTPLMSSDMPKYDWDTPLGKVGELPQYVEDPWRRLVFKSTNKGDDRWYDWRVQNWDTKWDAYDVVVTEDDPEQLEIEFNTAWSPPTAICNQIREDFPDIAVSWFYDEPGCEIAGYL